jgi:hypothetical protein
MYGCNSSPKRTRPELASATIIAGFEFAEPCSCERSPTVDIGNILVSRDHADGRLDARNRQRQRVLGALSHLGFEDRNTHPR